MPDRPTVNPSTAIALAARLGALQRHIASRSSNATWRATWNARLGTPAGWQSPGRVAGYLIEDHLTPAAASGDVARFDEYEQYIRVDLLEAPDWEQRCR
jgi:hypothetical protein